MKKSKKSKTQPKTLPPLSDAQFEIMQLIWTRSEATVSDIWEDLKKNRKIARNTVLTVMDRLEKRGWLTKKRIGNSYLYKPLVEQKKTLRQVVGRMVETAFSGAADQMVIALLDGRGLSDEEAKRIQKLIDQNRKSKQNKVK